MIKVCFLGFFFWGGGLQVNVENLNNLLNKSFEIIPNV